MCIPSGSALGATWNEALVEKIGRLAGADARQRGCRALLAPTVNLHRAPLAGRNFECYAEDPLLSGKLAAAFVRGVQSQGVIATVKHFVGNEAEYQRMSISALIDQRSLRELYLLPFELAIKEGGALGIMCAYNRVNGQWVTEQPDLLLGMLRDEWHFDGLVMTDWFAVADTVNSASAGLDLEMPGPGRAFGNRLVAAASAGDVAIADVDAAVRRQLGAWDRVGALDAPTPVQDIPAPTGDDLTLLRRAAGEATVLLHNDGVLPLDVTTLRRLAIIGPNANVSQIMGGGSSEVIAHPHPTPLEAIQRTLPTGVHWTYEPGCDIDPSPRPIGRPGLRSVSGFRVDFFAGPEPEGVSIVQRHVDDLRIQLFGSPIKDPLPDKWSMRARGTIVADETGVYLLALAQNGRARVALDGETVLDGIADPPPPGGTDFWGAISRDLVAEVELRAGKHVELLLEYTSVEATLPGVRVGFRPPTKGDAMGRAVATAGAADVAIVIVGTSAAWESESRDRVSFALPGEQDALVRRVSTVNERTVVVVNAGSAVDLPWVDQVSATLQCWFGGQEMAGAIAEIITGAREPGGRLATTIPRQIEHSPSHDNFPGENGEVRYGEGLFMGYRGYEHRQIAPRFPFGHGLSYTTFVLGQPTCPDLFRPGDRLTVSVPVTNVGHRPGAEVIQCYVAPTAARLCRPDQELKAFAKVHLAPGETALVDLELSDRSFSYWDPGQSDWEAVERKLHPDGSLSAPAEIRTQIVPGWQLDGGIYELRIGRSSADLPRACQIHIAEQTCNGPTMTEHNAPVGTRPDKPSTSEQEAS